MKEKSKEYYLHYQTGTPMEGELVPLFVGYEKCKVGHHFGPYVRPYFLVHICISGCGVLRDASGEHKVTAGELFVIRPGEVTSYTADAAEPWEYCWMGFLGDRASVFSTDRSVYPISTSYTARLLEKIKQREDSAECFSAFLHELIYRLFCMQTGTVTQDERVAIVRQYIDHHYMQHLRVEDLAYNMGFERSYLYRLFKKQFGIGVKEYITKVRMENAHALLEAGYGVGQVAHMVGYEDLFHFSKSFKAYFGDAPSKESKKST